MKIIECFLAKKENNLYIIQLAGAEELSKITNSGNEAFLAIAELIAAVFPLGVLYSI